MDGGESEKFQDVRLSDALVAMLEKLTGRLDTLAANQEKNKRELEQQMQSMEHRLGVRIDKLQHQVVGNGDEGAVIVRQRDQERTLQDIIRQQEKNTESISKLIDAYNTWRNRVIGIMIAFPIITALLVIVISHVLGIALAP